jgi:hypothetical protein
MPARKRPAQESAYPKAAVREAFTNARRGLGQSRRHPAEVTSDRLGDAASRWSSHFSGEELDAIALVRQALERIAGNA